MLQALIHYKRIKSIANVLAPLEQQLANLETILERIQTAETNSKVNIVFPCIVLVSIIITGIESI